MPHFRVFLQSNWIVPCLVGTGRLLLISVLGCLLSSHTWGQTLSSTKALGRYQQFIWTEEHGLPQNTVQAITRTRDGYLWLGTLAGVARFDGARFSAFNNVTTREIKGSYITALLEDRAGNLWISTDGGGLNLYRDGQFRRYTTAEGLADNRVLALAESSDGSIWIGTYNGLTRFKGDRFSTYTMRDGLPINVIQKIAEDRDGNLWVGTRNGLARFKEGRFMVYSVRDGLPDNFVRALYQDHAGKLWVGTELGLSQFEADHFVPVRAPAGLASFAVFSIHQDREKNLWFGTQGNGLFRLSEAGRWEHYTQRDGMPSDRVMEIYQAPEGDLWVGTDSGLVQLRDGRIQVYAAQEGLAHDYARTIYEDRAGNLWISTGNKQLSRFKDGKFKVYTTKDGLPENLINAIREDEAGNLWLGTYGGLVRFKEGRFTLLTTKDGLSRNNIRDMRADRAGNLWIGTTDGGLNLLRDGRVTVYTRSDGLASDDISGLFMDHTGALWIGTENAGISRFKDGRFTTWTSEQIGAKNAVRVLYEDHSGGLWLGTSNEGLIRFKHGKFVVITTRDGLYDNLLHQVLPDTDDDSGNLWISCDRGIYRVSLKDLNDFAEGRIRAITCVAYGITDGLLSRECNGGRPGGWRTQDGRLWFPTTKGIAVIDPRQQNTQPPLVAVERIMLNGVSLAINQTVRIQPGQENLEINYTALSWHRPQQIRFKYQLVGLDQTWVEAGARRTAYFPHLPPGDYTFKVIADNGEGSWNLAGRSLRISVLPPFYRTWWFLSLVTLAMIGLGTLVYQVRVRQLTRAKAAQEEFSRRLIESQEAERKRIAAELHDGLNQSLAIIKNRAMLSLSRPDDPQGAFDQLEEIVDSTTHAISEVREISYALRPFQIDRLGLTKALGSMVRKVADASGLPITAEIEPLDGLFSPEGEINLYRIVQEALNNLVRHAQASNARVIIKRQTQRLAVRIEDNGKGFVAGAGTNYEPGKGGFGLIGIVERARIFGVQPVIQSAPGQGTVITLEIPIPVAPLGRSELADSKTES